MAEFKISSSSHLSRRGIADIPRMLASNMGICQLEGNLAIDTLFLDLWGIIHRKSGEVSYDYGHHIERIKRKFQLGLFGTGPDQQVAESEFQGSVGIARRDSPLSAVTGGIDDGWRVLLISFPSLNPIYTISSRG